MLRVDYHGNGDKSIIPRFQPSSSIVHSKFLTGINSFYGTTVSNRSNSYRSVNGEKASLSGIEIFGQILSGSLQEPDNDDPDPQFQMM